MKKRIVKQIMVAILVLSIFVGLSDGVFNRTLALSQSSVDDLVNNTQILDADTIPEIISYQEAVDAGHIQRVHDEETDLSSVVFRNSDNTNTLYMFDENVKYIDSDGLIRDKNNVLQRNADGSYENSANDIRINYPAEIATGVLLEASGHIIRVIPHYSQNAKVSVALSSKKSEDIRAVSYRCAFGENTLLTYTQTFSGYKEDIILYEKPGINTFSFTVLTNGSAISVQDGTVVATSNGSIWGKFGDVVVYDASNAMIQGEVLVTEVIPNRQYTVTLSISSEFLLSDDTVYPVVIDPTFQVSSISSAANIQDLTIFSGNSSNYGTATSLYVGNSNLLTSSTSDDYGVARTYIKFPGLTTHTQFNRYYNAGRVTSVKLNFADINCTSGPTVIRAYHCAYSWTESSTYNTSIWNAHSSVAGTSSVTISPQVQSVPYPRYQIEIKQFIDYWRSGGNNNGIVLKAQDESLKAVLIGSSESGDAYSRSDSKPYLVVTYTAMPTSQIFTPITNGLYQFVNFSTSKALTYTSSFSANTSTPALASQRFKLKYAGSGMYYIETMYAGAQGKRISYNGSSLSIASASSSVYQKWYLVPNGSGYRIHSAYDSNFLLANPSASSVVAQNATVNSIWKINPICIDVPLIEQQDTDTCSAASALMLLHYYGCTDITEADYIEAAGGKNYSDFNFVYNIKNVINQYLVQYSHEVTYSHMNIANYTEAQLLQTIQNNMVNAHPVIVGIKVLDKNYFPYTTSSGHYVVITGAFLNSSNNTYYAVINDPHYDYCNEYVMPISAILGYIKAGNNYIIKVD